MYTLNIFLNYILQLYFLKIRCVLIFTDSHNAVNLNFRLPIIQVDVDAQGKFDNHVIFNNFGCQGFIISTQSASTSTATIKEIEYAIKRDTSERYNVRRYLVIVKHNQPEPSDILNEIFEIPEMEFIADFLLLLYKETNINNNNIEDINGFNNSTIEVYTHKFIGFKKHGAQEVIHLYTLHSDNNDTNADNELAKVNFYPDKLTNGQGRTFGLSTFTYKPYSVPEFNEGTELQVALEFCRQHNLTSYYMVDEEEDWGRLYDNWTGNGLFGNVLHDRCDVGFGALFTWDHSYIFLDFSLPVIRTGITCLAPKPHVVAVGWMLPLLSFTYEMWIGVGLTFLVCSIILALLDYNNQSKKGNTVSASVVLEESVMDTASIFLQQAFDRFGNSTFTMTFLHGCMFIFSILIASSYSSGLSSIMTVPKYEGAINTVQDLVDSGIQWGATSIFWVYSILVSDDYNYRVLTQQFVNTDDERLKKNNDKRFAFSIERLPGGYFAVGDYITEEGVAALKLMQEDIYWEQTVLMTKKSSIWMPRINIFILQLAQTGIPPVWEYRVATKHLNPKIQNAIRFTALHAEGSGALIKLQWGHVQGAFALLIIGNAVAIIRFIVELIQKKRNNRNILVN